MSDTNLTNARIQLKYDTEANWKKNAPTFIPRAGELIIYSPDEEYSSPRFKVGDGSTLLNRLPFSNGDLTMKNDTYSGWYNSDYIPKMGEIIIINSETASEPAQVRIGDGSTLVKDLPAFGDASDSSANAQKLVNSNGQGLNVATQGNRLIYFKDGVPTASNIYVYKTVPQDAVLTELATETEKGLLAPEEKVLLNELSEKAITKDNIGSSLPTASETVKGGVMIGENLVIDNGVLSAVIPDSEEIEDATTTTSGLMSAEDKIKLNNIEAEANKTIVDSVLNSTSTNPVQNKVINSEITKLGTLIIQENSSTLTSANRYTDDKIGELLGQAPENLNSLEELAAAMENNPDVVSALRGAIGNKANSSDLTATSSKLDLHTARTDNPHGVTAAQIGLGNVENKSVATIKNEILTEENISALGFITEVPEYTAPVTKVNGQTGEVQLTAADVGALSDDTELFSGDYADLSGAPTLAGVATSGSYNDLTDIPDTITVDANLTSTGTNPVQGKAIYSALAGKQAAGDYALTSSLPTSTQVSNWNTAYTHATNKGSAFSSGLYKITTNAHGHVTAATAVSKSDITSLGIAPSDVASTSAYGITKLSDSYNSDSIDLAATPYAVKQAYDLANSAKGLANAAANVAVDAKNSIPSSFVSSVNGKTGTVQLTIPSTLSELTQDPSYQTVTDDEKSTWNAKGNGTITKVTAGTGLSGGGDSGAITLKHSNSITAGSVGSKQTASFGNAFTIPQIEYDGQGHITKAITVDVTLPSAPSIDTSDFLTSSDLDGYVESDSLGTAAFQNTDYFATAGHAHSNYLTSDDLNGYVNSSTISSISVVSSLPSSGTSGILYLVKS